jgi:hypothetical protein
MTGFSLAVNATEGRALRWSPVSKAFLNPLWGIGCFQEISIKRREVPGLCLERTEMGIQEQGKNFTRSACASHTPRGLRPTLWRVFALASPKLKVKQ